MSVGYCPHSMVSEVPVVSVGAPWCLEATAGLDSMVSEVPIVSVGAPWCLEATAQIPWCPRCP